MSHQRNLIGQNILGEYVNIQTDIEGRLKTDSSKTAFGEGLVGQLSPVLQETFHYSVNPRIWDIKDTEGTVSILSSMATMTTYPTPDGLAGIFSRQRVKYRAGMGVLCRFTALWVTDDSLPFLSYIGIGDESLSNGFYFSMSELGMFILHANDGVFVSIISQENWDDPCDGSESMPFMNWDKGNVFQIQFQYLGFGAIKFYIENPNTGDFQLIHTIKYANSNDAPSLRNTTLPFTATIQNTGAGDGVQILKTSSVGVFVEGKNEISGIRNTYSITAVATATEEAVFTLLNKSIFNGITNNSIVYPQYISISNSDTKTAIVKLVENTTLGGIPVFNDIAGIDPNTSLVSVDIAGTTLAGGNSLLTVLIAPASNERIDLEDYGISIYSGETLTLSSFTGNNTAELVYTIGWKEDF